MKSIKNIKIINTNTNLLFVSKGKIGTNSEDTMPNISYGINPVLTIKSKNKI